MKTSAKVIPLFSQPQENGEKTAAHSVSEKIAKTPRNKGFSTAYGNPPTEELGSIGKTLKKKGAKKKRDIKKAQPNSKPPIAATPGQEGYQIDCAQMTPGQLQAAYPLDYNSWRNSKNRCKRKGWPWDSEWETFKGLLLSMGPKPTPAHTLDRIDNALGAYGPGLCRWADKATQNNNKSDNVKIIIPLTGELFTVKKLAKLHGVLPKTVYKWKAYSYSTLEMLAGKKSEPLRALNIALDGIAGSLPQKGDTPLAYHLSILFPVWIQAMDEAYPGGSGLSRRSKNYLYEAAKRLAEGGMLDCAVDILRFAIKNWSDFTQKAKAEESAWSIPEIPTPKFFHDYLDSAVRFWRDSLKKKKAVSHVSQMSPSPPPAPVRKYTDEPYDITHLPLVCWDTSGAADRLRKWVDQHLRSYNEYYTARTGKHPPPECCCDPVDEDELVKFLRSCRVAITWKELMADW